MMIKSIENVRIEKVGDIHSVFPYLEVFLRDDINPFLEIGISEERQLFFKIYPLYNNLSISIEIWEYLYLIAKEFLPQALKNEDDSQIFEEN